MPERRHRAPFDHAHAAVTLGPGCSAAKAEFRPPTEPARQRREANLEQLPWPVFGADMVDQNDLATRPDDTRKLVERSFRIGHRGDDELRHYHVDRLVGHPHPLASHT